MVRVISAHHFASQDVATCGAAPVCSAVAENWLLLATQLHQVEVRDLAATAQAVFWIRIRSQVAVL